MRAASGRLPGDEAAHQAGHAQQVGDGRRHDVDPRVGIVDPVDGYLVDAHAGPLGQEEELGVEEPPRVLDERQQGAGPVGADGLEPALGVGEARRQGGAQQRGCSTARSPRAWCRAPRATRGPGECRWPCRCGPRRAVRPAGAPRPGRWTGRRPCRRAPRRRSATTPGAVPGPGPCRRGARRTQALARRSRSRAIAHVASVLALSATVIRKVKGSVALR